jgi:hypothetical protein
MSIITRCGLALLLVACGEKKAPPTSSNVASAAKPEPRAEWFRHVDLPVVDGFKTPSTIEGGVVIVTPTSIVVDGTSIVGLTEGVADPSDREGGTLGVKIPRLTKFLAAYKEQHPLEVLPLAFDKSVPYRTFFEVVFSAKQRDAGFNTFVILAKTKQGTLAEAPFALPDMVRSSDDDAAAFADLLGGEGAAPEPPGKRRPGADLGEQIAGIKKAGGTSKDGPAKAKDKEAAPKKAEPKVATRRDPDEDGTARAEMIAGSDVPAAPDGTVRLCVAITKTNVRLFSFSGLEGTLSRPKLDVPVDGAAAPLRGTLEGIVERRWSGKERTEQAILIMAEGAVPMQRVEEIIGAVRADAAGKPLFPEINFSSGFE